MKILLPFNLFKKVLLVAMPLTAGILLMDSCTNPDSGGVNCSNAQLCIQNQSGKVVHYQFDQQPGYTDSIMPGGSACKYVGKVVVNSTTSQTVTTWFYSDRGNYAITVSQCSQTQIIK
jgi:hypothetical protein